MIIKLRPITCIQKIISKMKKGLFRLRRNEIIVVIGILVCVICYYTRISFRNSGYKEKGRPLKRGISCEIAQLDPFAQEMTQFNRKMPKVVCQGTDWVKCYLSECRVVPEVLKTMNDVICTYRDIMYQNDNKYVIGPPQDVPGAEVFELVNSDHVKVQCTGKRKGNVFPSTWVGHLIGFRSTAIPKSPPIGKENTLNVLIFGFDSTAKNGFIRRMPKSYEVLTKFLGATVLQGYNVVGDGTPGALFPILTGKTELELHYETKNISTLDSMPFIFYKVKEEGYRTAYFEDMPWLGTFKYRFKGFKRQPVDHYLRDFFMEESKNGRKGSKIQKRYCVGDTPQYKLMMNITEQFFHLDGNKFGVTFINDICHDNFNMISTADEDMAQFLTRLRNKGITDNTLLLVMGDHGPRYYAEIRDTLQGRLEERLPLMIIRLPEALKRTRPGVQNYLEMNSEVLTTPHDIYATVLDVLDLTQQWNKDKAPEAYLIRGLSLLDFIPSFRSCSDAGIEPRWCSCLSWETLNSDDQLYIKSADTVVKYINTLTESNRSRCAVRTLESVEWVMRQRINDGLLKVLVAADLNNNADKFAARFRFTRENYQLKIVVGPGRAVYEAFLTYVVREAKFLIDSRDISRMNAYNNEPNCISAKYPHLNMYCYCI